MSNQVIHLNLNSLYACSHAWNSSQGHAFHKRCFHAIEAFFNGLLGRYSVEITEARAYIESSMKSTYAGEILTRKIEKIDSADVENKIPNVTIPSASKHDETSDQPNVATFQYNEIPSQHKNRVLQDSERSAQNQEKSYEDNEISPRSEELRRPDTPELLHEHQNEIHNSPELHTIVSYETTEESQTEAISISDNVCRIDNSLIFKSQDIVELPENLTINGDLTLSNCNNFKSLPKGLKVTGNIYIDNCKNFEHVSEDVSATLLEIQICNNLKAIDRNLNVQHLKLIDCKNVHKLPDHLLLERLTLKFCQNLKGMLCTSLTVKESLSICHCDEIDKISKKLEADNIAIHSCIEVKMLADEIKVSNIQIQYCSKLQSLTSMPSLNINSLSMSHSTAVNLDNTNIFNFPETFVVNDFMILERCHGIKKLPSSLSLMNKLHIESCSNLLGLKNEHFNTKSLRLVDCQSFVQMPEKTTVTESFFISNLPLRSIGSILTHGQFEIYGCEYLQSLEDIKIGGDLKVHDCNELPSLPENIEIGGSLEINSCNKFDLLDAPLAIGKHITIENCPNLAQIPNWLTLLGYFQENTVRRTRSVTLNNTGIQPGDYEPENGNPGMELEINYLTESEEVFDNWQDAVEFWKRMANNREATVDLNRIELNDFQSQTLNNFLSQLIDSKEYRNKDKRHLLAERIINILPLLYDQEPNSENCEALIPVVSRKETIINIMFDSLTDCQDRTALGLNQIEVNLELVQVEEAINAGKMVETNLREIGLKFMRLKILDDFTSLYIVSNQNTEAVEVALAFRIGVRKHNIEIPGSVQDMHFFGLAKINDETINQAVNTLNEQCTDPGDKFDQFLESWDPWKRYQLNKSMPSYESLDILNVSVLYPCKITNDTTDTMVALTHSEPPIQVSYRALRRCHLDNNKNPYTDLPIDWSQVFRIEKR